ncbi:hypothetical protein [Streptomyces filamentosus]|uniref:Uncharacterized protein n=1 Tax=Streptomyces filamentosus TaxID=67294 RepID=A0A919EPC9_STRFL|nr:hypothetical protein [Streptomyces filamentosus]GHG05030.1 hypothetical protein GCM10017667_39640 [Streptomyces filamentosus]
MGDVGEVGEVAGGGERAESADGDGQVLVVAADGVVEGESELHEPVEEGEPRGLDVGPQALGAGGDVAVAGSGVFDQGDDLGEEGVGALVEALKELVGERELVGGSGGVGEGDCEGEADLHHGALAGGGVLFGFGAACFEGVDGGRGVGMGPVDVAEDAVVAALPAQDRDGGQGCGEVAGESGHVGERPAGLDGEVALAVDDLLHAGAGEYWPCTAPMLTGSWYELFFEGAGAAWPT